MKIAPARVADSITGRFDQIWATSRQAQNGLPYFEEVAVGELGESAAATALFRPDEQGRWLVLRKGARLGAWLKSDPGEFLDPASGLESEALAAALSFALSSRAAIRARVPIIGDGVFDVLDVLALPLATRWGFELVMIVAEPRALRLNIAEVLTRSCKEGLLALTVWRERPECAADFRVVGANQAALEILGAEGSPVVGARLSMLLGGHQGQTEMLEILRLCARDRSQRNFHACFDSGGRRRDVQIGISPSDDLFAVTFTDVSEMKAREESFRLLFEANPLPMTICDRETLDFVAVNAAARGAWRSNGKPVTNFEDVWPEARPEDLPMLVDNAGAHMLTLMTADGNELQALAYGRNLISDGRDRCLLAFVDVTERRRAEERIERLAHNDPLTGLDNRASYMVKLERALSDGALARGRLAVVVVDLDHFKEVNDTLGHPVGDRVLCEVAARLQARLSPDQTVARLGGDEFAILLPGQPSAQAVAAICALIIADLSAPYRIECDDIRLGASAGVALAPDHGADPNQLLKHADMALYQVKGSGRGQAGFFNEGLARSVLTRRDLGLALRRAIEVEEFILYYQPMVRISDGDLRGFEALLRWQRPGVGVTLPGEFIRQAEEMGLITEIGEWVIFEACREATRWPNDISVAVNVSPAQVRGSRLQRSVARALAETGLAPSRLELEITENVLLTDSDANLQALRELRALGVRIAMDDFGTGYSSLSNLRKFPFDKIKIDRSFVHDAIANVDSAAIVRAVTGLGTSLGITVTAEGVETADQLKLLRAEGCPEAQGYLFSRPMPVERIDDFLLSRTRSSQRGRVVAAA